ncbi:MAG: sigma-54-dependent Fis family transcriptional regulator [Myxococcales bacterium]
MERILVVDDEDGIRSFLAEALSDVGYAVVEAADGREAIDRLEAESFHLMVVDLKMPRMDGMDVVRRARASWPEMEIVVLTAHGTVATAVEAMKLGAFDYLTKPLSGPDELRLTVARGVERRRLADAHQERRDGEPDRLMAWDPSMVAVTAQLDRVAATDATVLLVGESGTGKEVAARAVHRSSPRRGGPFVAVNCAALSESLLESELFGHEKGAFTGATAQRRGRFELADGGTLFLDEVAEIAPHLQAKLLRVLQERRFERVGGTRTLVVDIRLVAATNKDLALELREGRFREDLYHRISVFPVRLPALRERPGDILPLAAHLLGRIAARLGRPGLVLDDAAKAALLAHPWPGNVRELANALERGAIVALTPRIGVADLSLGASVTPAGPAAGSLRELEREAIRQALAATGGHRRRAAERLGIGLRTLYDKLREYGLG